MKHSVRAVLAALAMAVGATAVMGIEIGQELGPLALRTLDDDPLVMSNYAERPGTVIVVMSSRCGTTDQHLPAINELYQRYRLRGVLFVGICPVEGVSGDELRGFCQRHGVVFPVYRDSDGKSAKRLGVRVTPTFVLVDKAGTVVYFGGMQGLSKAVSALVSGRPIDASATQPEGTPIETPGAKRDAPDPYGSLSFSSELIFEKIPGAPAHHCSTLAEAGNGDVLCLWYGGSYESADDQVLFLARQQKGRRSWSRPEVVLRNPGQPPGNAVIFVDGQRRVWIVWGRMEATRPIRRGGGWDQCRLVVRTSTDHGKTWSKDEVLKDAIGWLPRNVPIALRRHDQALLLPVTGRVDRKHGAFVLRTTDHGKTWQTSEWIGPGSQPTLIERDDGTLLALMRSAPRILQSTSRDGGRTWSPATKTDLKNPGAGIAMTRLAGGSAVLVFNDSETQRTPLSVTRSLDGGQTWERPLTLESNPGEYSYPCVIQTSDGKIHVSYTYRRYAIKHVTFDEGWLTHLSRPN